MVIRRALSAKEKMSLGLKCWEILPTRKKVLVLGAVMKKTHGLVVLALLVETALAKSLPPIGKRKYILDSKRPEIPATIEGINTPASAIAGADASRDVMKDPIPLDGKAGKELKVWKEPERVVAPSSKIKFQKLAVAGRYSVPRVSLDKERKVIEHAEQPVKQDFRKKVQESEDMLKDLNW